MHLQGHVYLMFAILVNHTIVWVIAKLHTKDTTVVCLYTKLVLFRLRKCLFCFMKRRRFDPVAPTCHIDGFHAMETVKCVIYKSNSLVIYRTSYLSTCIFCHLKSKIESCLFKTRQLIVVKTTISILKVLSTIPKIKSLNVIIYESL